jgi:quercetin dioxygenase-like cupin family protein
MASDDESRPLWKGRHTVAALARGERVDPSTYFLRTTRPLRDRTAEECVLESPRTSRHLTINGRSISVLDRERRKEIRMRTNRIIAAAVLTALSTLALRAAQDQQTGSKRTDLQRHDLSVPGREVIQVRVDFDPGYVSPRHTHPGEEIIYVIEGSLEYDVGGKPVKVKAGDVLFVPAGTVHAAKNVGSGNGAELATYVVEKGKPLITLVK